MLCFYFYSQNKFNKMLWREAGLTYLRFSQIAAQIARSCSKNVTKKSTATIKVTLWDNGKARKEIE